MSKNSPKNFLRATYKRSKPDRAKKTDNQTTIEAIQPMSLKAESQKNVLDEAVLHKAAIFVEGDTDKRVYQRFLHSCSYEVLPIYQDKSPGVNARNDVIDLVKRGRKVKEYTRILGIIDSDFAQVRGSRGPVKDDQHGQEVERVFFTDKHDLETMIMASHDFEELLERELKQRQKAIKGKTAKHVKAEVLADALLFGYVSYLSRKFNSKIFNPWKGITTKLKKTEVGIFYLNGRVDIDRLAEFVADFTGNRVSIDEIKEEIENSLKGHQAEDDWQICNGHVCVKLLRQCLEKFIPYSDKDWERRILGSYGIESFKKTNLYASVKKYVDRNKWTPVFQ